MKRPLETENCPFFPPPLSFPFPLCVLFDFFISTPTTFSTHSPSYTSGFSHQTQLSSVKYQNLFLLCCCCVGKQQLRFFLFFFVRMDFINSACIIIQFLSCTVLISSFSFRFVTSVSHRSRMITFRSQVTVADIPRHGLSSCSTAF